MLTDSSTLGNVINLPSNSPKDLSSSFSSILTWMATSESW